MATVREDLVADIDDTLFDDEGLVEEVTYSSTPINAHVIRGGEWDEESQKQINVMQIEIKVSDVARPGYRDAVVIDAATWYVDQIISGDGITWIVQLKQEGRATL